MSEALHTRPGRHGVSLLSLNSAFLSSWHLKNVLLAHSDTAVHGNSAYLVSGNQTLMLLQPWRTVFPCHGTAERSEGFVILGQITKWSKFTLYNNKMNWGEKNVLEVSERLLCILDNIFYTCFLWLSLLVPRSRISQIKQQGSLLCVPCLHSSLTFLHSLTLSANGSWGKSAEYSSNDMKKNTEGSSREASISPLSLPCPGTFQWPLDTSPGKL